MIRSSSLREFAKNSRLFAAFAPGANRVPQFFFPRKSGSQNYTGIRYANAAVNERNQVYETDTWNIAEGRSFVLNYALDFSSVRRAD